MPSHIPPSPRPTFEEIWRKYDPMECRLTAPVSERMLDLAGLGPGMHVLDLATGRGEPAIRAAHRVGPTGVVLGVDPAEGMLRIARERAQREGLSNLELRPISAESLDGVPVDCYHVTLARWCLMYFQSPIAALRAARRAMAPGGIFVAAVWVDPKQVSYVSLPRKTLERLAPIPPIDFNVPGTFYYADEARLRADFAAAGYSVKGVEEFETDVMEVQTSAEFVAWTLAFGMNRLLMNYPQTIQKAWEAEMLNEAERLRKNGLIRLGGVTRLLAAVPAK